MRIPINSTDDFSLQLNKLYNSISESYLGAVRKHIQLKKANVMLADLSVAQQETFDPQNVAMFYEMLTRKMKNWSAGGITKTDTDDLRRLHVLSVIAIENYSLSCYLALQYHSLPYFKVDSRIKDIQTQIMELDESISAIREEITKKGDALVEEELMKRDMANLSVEDMLQIMYNDQELYDQLTRKIDNLQTRNPEYLQKTKLRDQLLKELENKMVELYRTTPVLIDHQKLMQGEEGICISFDIEVSEKGEKIGSIETEKIPAEVKQRIIQTFQEVDLALKEVSA